MLKDKNNKLCNSFCQKHSVTHNASNCTISCDTNRTISNFQSCVHYKFCWVNTTTKAKNTDSVCVQTLPPGQSQSNTMFTTVYRMPAGVDTITEKGVTASFLPHKPIDRWDVSGVPAAHNWRGSSSFQVAGQESIYRDQRLAISGQALLISRQQMRVRQLPMSVSC